MYVYLCCFERNILYPVVFLACLTSDSPAIVRKLGPYAASLVITVCALKCLRCAFSHPPSQYLILAFACLFFQLDYAAHSETFIVDYFVTAIAFSKTHEFLLKVSTVVVLLFVQFECYNSLCGFYGAPKIPKLFSLSCLLRTPTSTSVNQ